MNVDRHFTATTYIVRDGKVLLHLHAKQNLWLPPGGHIEPNELPHHAALREVEEETGLQVRLHSEAEAAALSDEMEIPVVPQPAFILVEDIGGPHHQHIDLHYFARAPEGVDEDALLRATGFRFFAPEEMEMDRVPSNVKAGARRAIAHFGPESGYTYE